MAPGGVVIDEIGYTQDAPLRCFDKLETRRGVDSLPFAQFLDDVLNFPHLVFRALTRIHIWNVDNCLLGRIKDIEDVVNLRAGIEEIPNIELLEILVAVELFVICVGHRLKLCFVLRGKHGLRISPKV